MRGGAIPILLGALCIASHAANVPFEQLGHVFNQTNVNLIWNAPTNDLPRNLWVYRVLPSKFSPAETSNLMTLGAFTDADRRPVPNHPQTLSFVVLDTKRTLRIDPERGYFTYTDSEADKMKIVEGVPDEKQAFRLATNYFPMLGIDPSQLAKKDGGSGLRTFSAYGQAVLYRGLKQPAYATNVHMRGVYFIRSLDGVDFVGTGGRGGYMIEFGHDAKVSSITVSWRKLGRDKLYPVANPVTIMKWIREGRVVCESSPDYAIEWPSLKNMTINKVTPYYFGEVYSEPQNFVSPFATIEAAVETGQTNLTVYLHCPIIDETKPSVKQSPDN
jgi:hypothetical protein